MYHSFNRLLSKINIKYYKHCLICSKMYNGYIRKEVLPHMNNATLRIIQLKIDRINQMIDNYYQNEFVTSSEYEQYQPKHIEIDNIIENNYSIDYVFDKLLDEVVTYQDWDNSLSQIVEQNSEDETAQFVKTYMSYILSNIDEVLQFLVIYIQEVFLNYREQLFNFVENIHDEHVRNKVLDNIDTNRYLIDIENVTVELLQDIATDYKYVEQTVNNERKKEG